MNLRIKKVIAGTSLALALSLSALVGLNGNASAACFQYTTNNFQTSQTPVFNNICGVPTLLNSTDGQYPVGDESDFVRVRPDTSGDDTSNKNNPKLVNNLSAQCKDGDKFDVWTYIHNDASPDFNNNGTGTAVAHDVKLALAANDLNQTKSNFNFGSTVSASNAASVTDTATIDCGQNFKLVLVPSSVHYNNNYNFSTTWGSMADSAVNSTTPIGSPTWGSGDFWGCWEYATAVVYQVSVQQVTTPPVTPPVTPPATPPTPPKTPTPPVLPNTGAGSVLGIFGLTTAAAALLHRRWLANRG